MSVKNKKEKVEVIIFNKSSGKTNREYIGRFIGMVNKKQTIAILNSNTLQNKLIHVETKKLSSITNQEENTFSELRAIIVVNKIKNKQVVKFLFITELLDNMVCAQEGTVHWLTKQNGYIVFNLVDNDGNVIFE